MQNNISFKSNINFVSSKKFLRKFKKGKYIDFDAKETLNKTAFPLSNIHEHQTEHIRRIIKHGGIAFLIIRMNNITYLLTGEDYLYYIDTETRKSISYKYIEEKAHIIKEAYQPSLDYIKVLDEIYFKGGDV